MCFDENLMSSEYFAHALLRGTDPKILPSSNSMEEYVEPYTAPQTPPFIEADILHHSYQQLQTTPSAYTIFQSTPVTSRKRSFEESTEYSEEGDISQQCMFEQVAHQNPYLVHRLVMRSIHMEFAIEDQYNADEHKSPSIRIRKRRKPQECEWKPESVYKSYVECKPHFFEKSDYQDFIPRTSCFGKINMRIPKAWSRRPNKPKRLDTHDVPHYSAQYSYKLSNSSSSKPEPASLDEILAFDFLFE